MKDDRGLSIAYFSNNFETIWFKISYTCASVNKRDSLYIFMKNNEITSNINVRINRTDASLFVLRSNIYGAEGRRKNPAK
jgi:hypothetical protein